MLQIMKMENFMLYLNNEKVSELKYISNNFQIDLFCKLEN